jgi:hypothetical protein
VHRKKITKENEFILSRLKMSAKENIRRKLSVIAGFKWYNESDIYL